MNKSNRTLIKGPSVNELISAKEVRVISEKGDMLGVLKIEDAIKQAYEAGLDLVEVSPNASPPVCKIIDYGKYKYQIQKKQAEAKKKQKTFEVKEVKLRPGIEDHDYDVKLKSIHRFLSAGDKVKIYLRDSRPDAKTDVDSYDKELSGHYLIYKMRQYYSLVPKKECYSALTLVRDTLNKNC